MNNEFIYKCERCRKPTPLENVKMHTKICAYLEAIAHDANSSSFHPINSK